MEIESGDCKHVMDDRDLKRERRGSIETEVSQHTFPPSARHLKTVINDVTLMISH
jgi:hypothetical protein